VTVVSVVVARDLRARRSSSLFCSAESSFCIPASVPALSSAITGEVSLGLAVDVFV
jgi:hypothetical protein